MKGGTFEDIVASSGVDQGCSLAAFAFAAAIAPETQNVLTHICNTLDNGAKLFTYLDDWYLWIRPTCINVALRDIKSHAAKLNLELQPTKIQIRAAECVHPIGPEYRKLARPTMNCLGGHSRIQGDTDNNPIELGNEVQAVEKTRNRLN